MRFALLFALVLVVVGGFNINGVAPALRRCGGGTWTTGSITNFGRYDTCSNDNLHAFPFEFSDPRLFQERIVSATVELAAKGDTYNGPLHVSIGVQLDTVSNGMLSGQSITPVLSSQVDWFVPFSAWPSDDDKVETIDISALIYEVMRANPDLSSSSRLNVVFTPLSDSPGYRQVKETSGDFKLKVTTTAFPTVDANAIAKISPNVIGADELVPITITPGSTSYQGYLSISTTSNCANVISGTRKFVPVMDEASAVSLSISYVPNVYVCFARDTGTGVLQSLPEASLAIVEAAGDSIKSFYPTAVGTGQSVDFSFSGAIATPSTRIGFFTTSGCGGTPYIMSYATPGVKSLPSFSAATVLYLCYTVRSSGGWVLQTGLQLDVHDSTGLSTISPSTIAAFTTPDLLFSTVRRTDTGTQVAFTLSNCGSAVGLTNYDEYALAPVPLGVGISTPGVYTACYGFQGGPLMAQAATLTVVGGLDGAVLGISPNVWKANVLTRVTVTGPPFVEGSVVEFTASTCGSGSTFSLMEIEGSTVADVTIAEGDYVVCYGPGSGTLEGNDPDLTVTVVPDATSSVFNNAGGDAIQVAGTPTREIGDGVAFTFVGSAPVVSGGQIAFAENGRCGSPSTFYAQAAYDSVQTVAMTMAMPEPKLYTSVDVVLCYTVDSVSWQQQSDTELTVTVHSAKPSSLTKASPTVFLASSVPAEAVVTGLVALTTARIGFVPTGTGCSVGPVRGVTGYVGSDNRITFSEAFSSVGDYRLCYSVNNGASWVDQTAVLFSATDDVAASLVTDIEPKAVATSTPTDFDVTLRSWSLNDALAFAPVGQCATPSARLYEYVFGTSNGDGGVVTISTDGVDFDARRTLAICMRVEGSRWVEQIEEGATLEVITAESTSISGVVPRVIGSGLASVAVEFLSADGSPTTEIGLDGSEPKDCSPPDYSFELGSGNVLTIDTPPFSTGVINGTFAICYSINDGTSYVKQTSPGVELVVQQAQVDSLVSMSRTIMGKGTRLSVTFTFAHSLVSTARLGFSSVDGDCTSVSNVFTVFNGDSRVLNIFVNAPGSIAATYTMCFSMNGGSTWAPQDERMEVFVASSTSLSLVSPRHIGANTVPAVTFSGARVSQTTLVAFARTAGDCASASRRISPTKLSASDTKVISAPILPTSTTSYVICYCVNGESPATSEEWVAQDTTGVTVHVATADAIGGVLPSLVGNNLNSELTFTGSAVAQVIATAKIAFTLGSCSSRNYEVAVSGATFNMVAIPVQGDYFVCYTVNGINWVLQSSSVVLKVVEAFSSSISALTPISVGVGVNTDFVFRDLIATDTTHVAFTTTNCNPGNRVSVTPVNIPGSETATINAFPSANLYKLCYSVNGVDYEEQTTPGVTVQAVDATPTSISGVSPEFLGLGTAVPEIRLTMTHTPPSSEIALTLSDCADGNRVSETAFTSPDVVLLSAPVTVSGVYSLCYKVYDTWVQQSSLSVTVIDATQSEVSGFGPALIGVGYLASVSLAMGSSPEISETTYFGFSTSSTCSGVSSATKVPLTGPFNSLPISAPFANGGSYYLCYTVNDGANWFRQTCGTCTISVVEAAADTITSVNPSIIEFGESATITYDGVTVLNTAFIAFAEPSRCNVPGSRVATREVTDNTLSHGSNVPTAVYAVCYSVDNGATWVEQSEVQFVVQNCKVISTCTECLEDNVCTWCLEDNTCGIDGSSCTVTPTDPELIEKSIIRPSSSNSTVCPVIKRIQTGGPIEGDTRITLEVTGLEYFPPGEYSVMWNNEVEVNASRLSTSELVTVSPPIPSTAASQVVLIEVLYKGVPYAPETPYRYYDCADETTCADCSELSQCGFCMHTQTCSVEAKCTRLWGGPDCPMVLSHDPRVGLPEGGEIVTLNGTFFLNMSDGIEEELRNLTYDPFNGTYEGMQCLFGTFDDGTVVNATYISENELLCTAPPHPSGFVALTVLYNGVEYTQARRGNYQYQDPESDAVAVDDDDGTSAAVVAVSVSLALLCLLVSIAAVLLATREYIRKKQMDMMPPKLTPARKAEIVFGTKQASFPNSKNLLPVLSELEEMLLDPTNIVLNAMVEATQSTETDKVSKNMVFLAEARGQCLEVIKRAVSTEVNAASHQSTMFRTNSFATKMFKTYSKIVGLQYLFDSLAFPLSKELAGDLKEIDIKVESTEANLDAFALLGKCQVIFNAIVESEPVVPGQFRNLFAHVREAMQQKWPAHTDNLAELVASRLQERLLDTREAFEEGRDSFRDVEGFKANINSDLDMLRRIVGPMQTSFANFKGNVEFLSKKTSDMLRAFNELEGALDPDSEQAQKFLEEHARAQNCIAVGGFFFLRFLVPALTAPEAYSLVKKIPTREQRQLLVYIGKVLQNLSNNQLFGRKEVSMEKLNEFIISNTLNVQQLFQKLSTPSATAPNDAVEVTPRVADTALLELHAHVANHAERIVEILRAPVDDKRRAVEREAVAERLIAVLAKCEEATHNDSSRFSSLSKFAPASSASKSSDDSGDNDNKSEDSSSRQSEGLLNE